MRNVFLTQVIVALSLLVGAITIGVFGVSFETFAVGAMAFAGIIAFFLFYSAYKA